MNKFLGSACDGETEEQQMERENEWKNQHSCNLCGSFECDGNCQEVQ